MFNDKFFSSYMPLLYYIQSTDCVLRLIIRINKQKSRWYYLTIVNNHQDETKLNVFIYIIIEHV